MQRPPFCNPLKGTVSSGFGARESKFQNVTGYHTGVDIAANSGTPIVAAMQGIVELVSTLVTTIVVLIFGEITPKTIAKEHADSLAIKLSGVVILIIVEFLMFISIIDFAIVMGFKSKEKRILKSFFSISWYVKSSPDFSFIPAK